MDRLPSEYDPSSNVRSDDDNLIISYDPNIVHHWLSVTLAWQHGQPHAKALTPIEARSRLRTLSIADEVAEVKFLLFVQKHHFSRNSGSETSVKSVKSAKKTHFPPIFHRLAEI